MLHEHEQRHGIPHAKAKEEWIPKTCVIDGKTKGTSKQGINDCGIHVCLVSMLLQRNLPLNVPGKGRSRLAMAGTEIRRRIAITLETGVYMFERTAEKENVIPELKGVVVQNAEKEDRYIDCIPCSKDNVETLVHDVKVLDAANKLHRKQAKIIIDAKQTGDKRRRN